MLLQADWGSLADAMAVVEFMCTFGHLLGAKLLSLAQLRSAAAWPLDGDVLPQLYLALLRYLLQEQVHWRAPKIHTIPQHSDLPLASFCSVVLLQP